MTWTSLMRPGNILEDTRKEDKTINDAHVFYHHDHCFFSNPVILITLNDL